MPVRTLLALSLGFNVALGVWLYSLWSKVGPPPAPRPNTVLAKSAPTTRTNVVVRRQNFSWKEIESEDYPTYIANLRSIGCPEQTIRDIIIADVNALYAKRRATEVVSSSQQWWKSEPDLDVIEAGAAKILALEAERRALLTRLLGPNWDLQALARSNPNLDTGLDGPVLGALNDETRSAVRDIEARALKRLQAYIDSQTASNRPADRAELARFENQTRQELAAVLSPEQLEEYLLRYSRNAIELREELSGLQLNPDEFRSLFRIRDPIQQQMDLYLNENDPNGAKQRNSLDAQRDQALRQVLGEDRYHVYRLQRDPEFRNIKETAEQIGADPETVLPLYQMQQALQSERQRISNDSALSAEEREEAIRSAVAAQQKTLRTLLGEEAYQRFQTGQNQP